MKSQLSFAFLVTLCGICANASTIFSDLGPGGAYNSGEWFPVFGSNATIDPASQTEADLFIAAGSGSESVSEIDLGAGLAGCGCGATTTFYASIWTDDSGVPGAELANAYWTFTNTTEPGNLASITGISGVSLTGGADYFMVVGPQNLTDDGYLGWYVNDQGVDNLGLSSSDGGVTWAGGVGITGAFDVQGSAPEPSTLSLLGSAAALLGIHKLLGNRTARRGSPQRPLFGAKALRV